MGRRRLFQGKEKTAIVYLSLPFSCHPLHHSHSACCWWGTQGTTTATIPSNALQPHYTALRGEQDLEVFIARCPLLIKYSIQTQKTLLRVLYLSLLLPLCLSPKSVETLNFEESLTRVEFVGNRETKSYTSFLKLKQENKEIIRVKVEKSHSTIYHESFFPLPVV